MSGKTMVGVDVGASGIKGAIVNIETGELLTERHKLPTPKPATPQAMAGTFAELIKMLDWNGPIGCGFPAIIK
jgi:polyphosphate glucokinase